MQNSTYVFFLGSNPALSATEVWRVLRHGNYQPALIVGNSIFMAIKTSRPIPYSLFKNLGGSLRVGNLLGISETAWTAEGIAKIIFSKSEFNKKISLGVSVINMPREYVRQVALDLKKWVKSAHGSLRFILPQKGSRLNAATVIFNRLAADPNMEITVIQHNDAFYLVKTIFVQDIQAYERRDTARPVRDPKVGMLPPKLAQIIMNIGISEINAPSPLAILDPFCGMGAILQEGWLMGHKLTGSDVSLRMISASKQNLSWLQPQIAVNTDLEPDVFPHDATLPFPDKFKGYFDAVVTEPYLGEPLSAPLPSAELYAREESLTRMYILALRQIHLVLNNSGILVFLLPVPRTDSNKQPWAYMPNSFLDGIRQIGYSKIHLLPKELASIFSTNERGSILYARPDALVGRELMLWRKV